MKKLGYTKKPRGTFMVQRGYLCRSPLGGVILKDYNLMVGLSK